MKQIAAGVLLSLFSAFAAAQSGGMKGMDMKNMKNMDMKGMQAKSHHAVGRVKSVDAAKGTLTLAHEPVASMSWPAMTMTFKAKDKSALQGIRPGQKVEIDFESQGKDHVVTKVN